MKKKKREGVLKRGRFQSLNVLQEYKTINDWMSSHTFVLFHLLSLFAHFFFFSSDIKTERKHVTNIKNSDRRHLPLQEIR